MSVGFIERDRRRRAGQIHLGTQAGGADLLIDRDLLSTHAQFLGPTGTGKTRALQYVAEQLIAMDDCAVVVLDPHDGKPPYGGLYHALKAYCYDHDHADRLITIDPDDVWTHGMVAGFNPLAHGRSPIVQAGLAVEHLRAVVGDNPEFAAAPMLARWSFNTFLGLIVGKLTMADALHVLRLEDPTYRQAFGELLRDRYADVASDWSWIADLKQQRNAQEILDAKLGSTTNRLREYANNESIRHMINTTERVVDAGAAIRERKVVLANLHPRGMIRTADQRMLGIQLMHAFCRAAMDRHDPEGVPCYVIVDEFSEFMTPEVLEILDGGRKFGIHLILAHQHLQQLQDVARQDWRYYHAVMTNTRLKVVFGGLAPTDAAAMGDQLYGAHLDPDRVKQEIYGTVQTSHLEWMTITSNTHASGSNSSRSGGSSSGRSDSDSHGSARTTSDVFDAMPTVSQTFSDGYGSALSASTSSSWGDGESTMDSETTATVPVNVPSEPFQELRSREFMSLEEQLYRHASAMRRMPDRDALLQVRGDYPVRFRVAQVNDPLFTFQEVLGPDRERLGQAAWASPVEDIEEEARNRDRAFRQLVDLPAPTASDELPPLAEVLSRARGSRPAAEKKPRPRRRKPRAGE